MTKGLAGPGVPASAVAPSAPPPELPSSPDPVLASDPLPAPESVPPPMTVPVLLASVPLVPELLLPLPPKLAPVDELAEALLPGDGVPQPAVVAAGIRSK